MFQNDDGSVVLAEDSQFTCAFQGSDGLGLGISCTMWSDLLRSALDTGLGGLILWRRWQGIGMFIFRAAGVRKWGRFASVRVDLHQLNAVLSPFSVLLRGKL